MVSFVKNETTGADHLKINIETFHYALFVYVINILVCNSFVIPAL